MDDQQLTRFFLNLTRRQQEVLELTSAGMKNRQIAECLYIQPSVVAGHLSTIYAELETIEGFADSHPNRFVLISTFAGYFKRNPQMRRKQ